MNSMINCSCMECINVLEQLRRLKTATEQATQTFAASQAEELFHPQLEALLDTWLSNKLPEVVQKEGA